MFNIIVSYHTIQLRDQIFIFYFGFHNSGCHRKKKKKYIDFCQGFINGKLDKQLIVPIGQYILLLTNGKISTGLSLVICIVCLTDMLSKLRHS